MSAARWCTLVVAHGSIDAGWTALVSSCVPASLPAVEGPVALGFLEEVPQRTIERALRELEAADCTHAAVVPLFVSSASQDVAEVRYVLGLGPRPAKAHVGDPIATALELRWTSALDDAPELAAIVAERARALGGAPDEMTLVLAGHGARRAETLRAWRRQFSALCRQLKAKASWRACTYGFLSPDTLAPICTRAARRGPVAVVPVMLSGGYFSEQVRRRVAGVTGCRFDGQPLLPHPLIAAWLGRQAARARGIDLGSSLSAARPPEI